MATPRFDRAPLHSSFAAQAERCYAAGHRALEQGDLIHAERLFALMVVLAGRDERGFVGLAATAERRGKWPLAAALYRAGSALARDPVRCHLGLGRALARLGRFREAERALDEAERTTYDSDLLSAIARQRASNDLH